MARGQSRQEMAFTMVEILATVAIVAILTIALIVFIPSFIAWAQQSSDKQTLTILNDALDRYKTEGGSLAALTSSAPIGHVMAKLGGTISWGGVIHQVMDKGQTFPSRSISAAGNGSGYYFTRFNNFMQVAVTSGGGGATHGVQTYYTPGTYTWKVPAGISSVEVLVVGGGGGGGQDTLSGQNGGGGGGAGGLIHNTSYAVTAGANLSVTVGAGCQFNQWNNTYGEPIGGDSFFDSLQAYGGGSGDFNNGGQNGYGQGYWGGSGGGGSVSNYVTYQSGQINDQGGPSQPGQGNDGGWSYATMSYGCVGGGGGGAGAAGQNGSEGGAGSGGAGLSISIAGVNGGAATYYAGGGAGGDPYGPSGDPYGMGPATAGQGTIGQGGGGMYGNTGGFAPGGDGNGDGNNGCVIIKY